LMAANPSLVFLPGFGWPGVKIAMRDRLGTGPL
jgi:hypothetical protein